mgnify:CR=1 FL=1
MPAARIPDQEQHYQRIERLAREYRGRCVTCGRRRCRCGDGRIGVYGGRNAGHYGYQLEERGGRLSYRPIAGELDDVRRVFRAYGRLGSAIRVSRWLADHGHRGYGPRWVLRILRCPVHLAAGEVDPVSYTVAMNRLERR